MAVNLDRVINECAALRRGYRYALCKDGIEDARMGKIAPVDACVAMSELTGARWYFCGPTRIPPEGGITMECAEALLAQWEGLDNEAAVLTRETLSLVRVNSGPDTVEVCDE